LRLKAAKKAGLKTVPAVEIDPTIPEEKLLELSLAENIHRQPLNPYDEAETYRILREKGVKQKDLATVVSKKRPYISKRLRLLRLHPKIREMVRQRTLGPEHCQELLKIKDQELQLKIAEEAVNQKLPVHSLRKRVKEILGKKPKYQLIPIRLTIEEYEKLKQIAPQGDIKQLIQETIKKLTKQ